MSEGGPPAEPGKAPGRGGSPNNAPSNAKIQNEKRIAEFKASKLTRNMLKEYCISMNKKMVSNVSKIVDRLEIDNQTEIFQKVADQFFDTKLSDVYIDELKSVTRVSVKKNLRGILYDHFKSDLKIEKEEDKKKEEEEEAKANQTGGNDDAAGGEDEKEEGNEDGGEDGDKEGEDEGDSGSGASSDDAGGMSLQILEKINDILLNDDELLKEIKQGIIENVTSGSFVNAMKREVFAKLVPKLETIIETKIIDILDTDELKNAAIEVTKEQQLTYNKQNKQGGKKHSIKKNVKPRGKKTRKHHI